MVCGDGANVNSVAAVHCVSNAMKVYVMYVFYSFFSAFFRT